MVWPKKVNDLSGKRRRGQQMENTRESNNRGKRLKKTMEWPSSMKTKNNTPIEDTWSEEW